MIYEKTIAEAVEALAQQQKKQYELTPGVIANDLHNFLMSLIASGFSREESMQVLVAWVYHYGHG